MWQFVSGFRTQAESGGAAAFGGIPFHAAAHGRVYRKPEPTLRLLPVYLQPASAGTGQWLDDDAQEMTEVDESVPAKAEFGVRIAGDSMEPRFVNGQTVWVKAAQDANNGDIVLCTLNDQGYCKKLRKDKNGIALISLNKNTPPSLCVRRTSSESPVL